MFVLALLFCLKADPTQCRPLVYPDLEPMSQMACLVSSQMTAAQMLATEPELQGYELRRARCEPENKPRESGA